MSGKLTPTETCAVAHVSGKCQGRYVTGDFRGAGCIERAKEQRQGLVLCRMHAKVLDRWMRYGIDYAWSIVNLEWQRNLTTGDGLQTVAPKDSDSPAGTGTGKTE